MGMEAVVMTTAGLIIFAGVFTSSYVKPASPTPEQIHAITLVTALLLLLRSLVLGLRRVRSLSLCLARARFLLVAQALVLRAQADVILLGIPANTWPCNQLYIRTDSPP